MSEDLKEKVFEALEFQWLHKPEPPYEAKTIEEVTDKLRKVLPDIPVEIIREEAEYWLDCYIKGII